MPDNKYVVLCRGDEHEADLEVFGPFDSYEAADKWIEDTDSADSCPNDHDIEQIMPVRD